MKDPERKNRYISIKILVDVETGEELDPSQLIGYHFLKKVKTIDNETDRTKTRIIWTHEYQREERATGQLSLFRRPE